MPELKPCPFCGGIAAIKHQDVYMSKAIFVHCTKCKARVMEYFEGVHGFGDAKRYQTEEEATDKAIKAWNRRVGDDLMERMVDDGK